MSRISAGILVVERLLPAVGGTTPALGRSLADITLTSIRRWKIKLPYKFPITLFSIHTNSTFRRRCRIVDFRTQNVTGVIIARLGDDAAAVASRSRPDALGRAARGACFSQNSGYDGSERTYGLRAPKDSLCSSFGIRTGGRRSYSLASLAVRVASSRVRTHLRSLFARRVRSSQNSGHDGIRTHGHRMSSRAANATRIEVRRSVRTELRALEPLFQPDPKRRCGAGTPHREPAKSAVDSARRFNSRHGTLSPWQRVPESTA